MKKRLTIQERIANLKETEEEMLLGKLWEQSWTRRLFLVIIMYGIAALWLILVGEDLAFIKAFIPAAGYLLSTYSLPFVRAWWILKHRLNEIDADEQKGSTEQV